MTSTSSSKHLPVFHADLKSRGVPVGKDTLHAYLAHLEDAFLLFSISIATDSERRRQVNPRKVYPVDTGLMALFDFSGKSNLGHALETVVVHELQRRGSQVAYTRTHDALEVDFYSRSPSGEEALIQVCADLDNADTLAREIRALQRASETWPNATLQLITLNRPTTGNLPPEIELHLPTDWLLGS
jgi:predicted AAA+ superfamily ATPase